MSILLAFLFVFGPWEFQQAAQASTLYSRLDCDDWATAGESIEYDYDDNGACTYKATWQGAIGSGTKTQEVFSDYNLQGRLAEIVTDTDPDSATNDVQVTRYEYNNQGIRVAQVTFSLPQNRLYDPEESSYVTDGPETTTYLVDANNPTGYAQTLEELFDSDTLITRKTYTLGDDVIAQSEISWTWNASIPDWDPPVVSATQYLLYDGHGSTRNLAEYDASTGATIAAAYAYDGYGVRLGNQAEPTTATSLLYTGEHYDTAASSYYLRARWYDPANGRFNRIDPYAGNSEDPQSLHKYLYCHANPVNGIDPSGKNFNFSLSNMLVTVGMISLLSANYAFTPGSPEEVFDPGSDQMVVNCVWSFALAGPLTLLAHYVIVPAASGLRGLAGKVFSRTSGKYVPDRLARIVEAEYVNTIKLGAQEATDVFVANADDIAKITYADDLARRLTLLDDAGNYIDESLAVIEFDNPVKGLGQPVYRSNPGFIEGGFTQGGAEEYILPNYDISQLKNVTRRILPKRNP